MSNFYQDTLNEFHDKVKKSKEKTLTFDRDYLLTLLISIREEMEKENQAGYDNGYDDGYYQGECDYAEWSD